MASLSWRRALRPTPTLEQRLVGLSLALAGLLMLAALVLPLASVLIRAFQDGEGRFVGLAHVAAYLATPNLAAAAWNSFWTAAVTMLCVVPAAFAYAYALTRSCIPLKPLFRAVMLLPVLAPSLLPALALIYLFGNQGMLRWLLMGESVYGPIGIVLAQVFYCFPHAALILSVALSGADARLYEAAAVLKAGRGRIFATVTLPGAMGGIVSASVVVFTLVVTDFGIPKVIGGQFPVLATEIYKQVIGQQNFHMGAVVGLVLLLPAVAAFLIDLWAQRRQASVVSGRAVPLQPQPRPARDGPLFAFCLLVAGLLMGLVGIAVWGSFIRFWPWNLELTLANYDFARFDSAGWGSLWTSVRMAFFTALFGTVLVFLLAYLIERGGVGGPLPRLLGLAATLPLAVPGLVLGLAYILFFNDPANPLGFLYGSLALMVLNCIIHFYTVCHLTAVTAIRQLDPEFESVGASLRVPIWITFGRVTLPICLPATVDIFVYFFVNAMTTVSAVVFLYGPDTKPASVAVIHMDEAGQVSAAAAMAVAILAINILLKLLHLAAAGRIEQTTQAWRRR
ncbi:MAG: putative 2-aminoethylphosphonate ABC transporter permease subunit [Rhodovarius sp.]|nr:putative 2-aminoethylphosphonate ABC transporter permease subunit [Rhodovarius sp.]